MANIQDSSAKGGGDDSDPLPHVAVIYSVVDELRCGEACDLTAEVEVIATARGVGDALRSLGYRVDLLPVRTEADLRSALSTCDPATTLIFNLIEALNGSSQEHAKVPQVIRSFGLRYTGATAWSLARCMDKARAKRILRAHGVPTAPFQVCRTAARVAVRVPLPAIVKPVAEDGSLGINRDSVVTSREALRRQVDYVVGAYRQPALVEAFVSGREFNVSVWGNGTAHTLPLAELDFGDWPELTRVCHYFAKWDEAAPEYRTTAVRCPAEVDGDLADRIRAVALEAYHTMALTDYARVDIRVQDGVPYVLEVNPNPCLAADGGFATASRAAGYDYPHMLAQIVRWAWERPRKAARAGRAVLGAAVYAI